MMIRQVDIRGGVQAHSISRMRQGVPHRSNDRDTQPLIGDQVIGREHLVGFGMRGIIADKDGQTMHRVDLSRLAVIRLEDFALIVACISQIPSAHNDLGK